jgi:hypothetical protein
MEHVMKRIALSAVLALLAENDRNAKNAAEWEAASLHWMAERDQLKSEVERLNGLQPSLPPRPPEGYGLPRFGLRWNGPSNPLAVSMGDGYWTPWHLADQFKVENEQLREANDKLTRRNGMLEENVQTLSDTHVLYTWLRKKVDQPSNDVVAVQMNIGHDWVPVHELDRDLRTMIDQEVP